MTSSTNCGKVALCIVIFIAMCACAEQLPSAVISLDRLSSIWSVLPNSGRFQLLGGWLISSMLRQTSKIFIV